MGNDCEYSMQIGETGKRQSNSNHPSAFSILSYRPGMTKNVEICMADVLVQLIDECVTIPSDVLDILLANFTNKAAVSIFASTLFSFQSPF